MPNDDIETGLAGLTVAVTPEPQPPQIQEAATPQIAAVPHPGVPVQIGGVAPPALNKHPLPDGWTLNKVAGLVRDVAQNMYDLPTILKNHSLNEAQYQILSNNEFFKKALEQFTLDWHSAANTHKRLALEAAIALEDALPMVAARAHKTTEPLGEVVALVKTLAEIAGSIGNKGTNQLQGPSDKFKIIINLGADTIQREASATPIQISAVDERTGNSQTLQSVAETSRV